MKLMMRNWPWLAILLTASVICATYLLAQTQTTPTGVVAQPSGAASMKAAQPDAQEAADCLRLIEAVNEGDVQTALGILHTYGVAEATLLDMATHLGKSPVRVELKEPFLKASVAALALTDRMIRTNVETRLEGVVAGMGYGRPIWMPRRPNTWAIPSYDTDLLQCPISPIAVFNERLNDDCFIRYFKWYDRYAEYLHSVVLNGPNLSNAKLDATNFNQANRTLNALFQLIKARKPDAFVWLSVVKEDNHSDEAWLETMTFRPDGLQISNLRQFHSPFGETRARYLAILGTNTPMMVSGFYGYKAALQEKGQVLAAALKNGNRNVRQVAEFMANQQLGGIGVIVDQGLTQVEANLQALGYRGISVHWLLLAALANSKNAAPADKSDLPDSRVGVLDSFLRAKDYDRVFSLASNLITSSAPGDMDWMAGKLAEGMAWLSQTPPDTEDAIAALDEVIAVDLNDRPGRDHYVLTAVRWRMYAAGLTGDVEKSRALAQWVQNQPFRRDLKAAFLKAHKDLLSQTANPSK